MMLHTAELTAIAQQRHTSVEALCDLAYAGLEASSTATPGTVWEARIDYTDPDDWSQGYVLAAAKFGTLLAELHVRGFLTGEHPADQRLASVRRVRA